MKEITYKDECYRICESGIIVKKEFFNASSRRWEITTDCYNNCDEIPTSDNSKWGTSYSVVHTCTVDSPALIALNLQIGCRYGQDADNIFSVLLERQRESEEEARIAETNIFASVEDDFDFN